MSSDNSILLLHGALGSKAQFNHLKKSLDENFQVYSLNFEGHGNRNSFNAFSIELFTENVVSFLDKHNLSSVHIFGYSMGGYVALNLAKVQPDRVRKIVTFGTKFDWNKESAAKEVKMLDPAVIEKKVPDFAEHLKTVHHEARWKGVLAKTAEMMLDLGNKPRLSAKSLSAIQQRVMIGIGSKDKMVSEEESKMAADHLKNGELNVMEGFVHPIEENDLEELARTIGEFCQK